MLGRFDRTRQTSDTSSSRDLWIRTGTTVGLVLLCSCFVPAVPIFLGVLMIAALVLHAASRELRPFVDRVLRMPVARASTRHARLTLVGGAGVLLIISGAIGATTRGHLRSAWEQREGRREFVGQGVREHMQRANDLLAVGDVEGAELALLDAEAIADSDSERREEINALLERVHRSGDTDAILDVLTKLPQKEFETFQAGTSIPKDLEFGERALTRRAVELAVTQIEAARRLRATR